ncbi:MAG: response regulator [Syntrophobacteraceae bacterium]|nr:response regulator [Syntrophobacteraceae bacterium]
MNPASILVVEDEAIVAMEIKERLKAMGYALAGVAASGEQALELAQNGRPDLVLMDIRLQGDMDGITAAREIRKRFHLPIIFLAAHSEDATLDRAREVEPHGYILKPFHDQELRSAIEIGLYKHRAEEEMRRLNRLYDVLSQVNQAVVRAEQREELFAAVCRLVVERGRMDLAWIGCLDEATLQVRPVAGFGNHNDLLDKAAFDLQGLPGAGGNPVMAIREGRPFVCNDCSKESCLYPGGLAPRMFGFVSCASFPLRFQAEVFGALNICVAEPGYFREREIRLLEEVALDISFALDKIDENGRRKLAEKALAESEAKFRSYIENSPLAVFVADREGRLVDVNPAATRLLGYDAAALTGMNIVSLHPEEDRPKVLLDFSSLLEKGRIEGEYRLKRRDGGLVWVWLQAVMTADRRSLGYIRDITETRRSEEERTRVETQLRQAQKMEALGTLAGGIAHDFNNILGIISGYSEMAQADAADPALVREDLHEVLKAADRAKSLVRQILAFSRSSEQEKRPVQVGLIVREALKMLRATLPATIEVKYNITSRAVVLADPTQVHQVLMNLCTNSAHALGSAPGVLEVDLADVRLEPGSIPADSLLNLGPHVKLTVKDTGCGIDPAVADRIFDPFFTTKEKGVGTGLGLSVVQGIVQSHGGAITLESAPGKGAAFHVFFPAIREAEESQPVSEVSLPRGEESILVVDDEPMLARVVKQMLERLGYRVEVRTSGLDAIDVFRQRLADKPFDLIITDMTMPHLTGIDLIRALRSFRHDLPVIICTGFNDRLEGEAFETTGIQGLLMKPVILKDLACLVRKVIDARSRKSPA